MFAVRVDDASYVKEVRVATYAAYLSIYMPLDDGWIFVDGSSFLADSEVADFMTVPTTYYFDTHGVLHKDYGDIDNDVSELISPWT